MTRAGEGQSCRRPIYHSPVPDWSEAISPIHSPRPRSSARAIVASSLTTLAIGCGSGGGTGPVGPPASMTIVAGADQQGVAGQELPVAPSVRIRDASGRGVPGISVRFDVTGGGGMVSGDSVVTDGQGVAAAISWRMGPVSGTNTLRAQALGYPLSVTFTSNSSPGAPATLQIVSGGSNLSAVVGQEVSPKPAIRVRDAYGNPVANAVITWIVSVGGGAVIGPANTVTDNEGRTTVGGWRLGPVSGTNQLQARTANGLVATFSAIGVGVPAAITPVSPIDQSGYLNFAAPKTPRVKVTDSFGSPVQGVPVQFSISAGSGSIIGESATTDANGVAALGDWKLGSTEYSEVEATVPGFDGPPAKFTLTGTARPFTIDIRFLNTPPADLRDGYVAGAMRWMEVIVGDLPDFIAQLPSTWNCVNVAMPPITETIDDVVIFARIGPDDGVGGVLARAGPCALGERGGSRLTAIGYMQFDQADASNLSPEQFRHVVIHEMGHVLGLLESRWTFHNLMVPGVDPYYVGTQGLAAWPSLGISYAGNPVPIENTGGQGTAGSHWRESVLVTEVMTGWIEPAGVSMPLSAVTVGAVADLGYTVDHGAADAFIPSLLQRGALGTKTKLTEVVFEAPWQLDRSGKLVPID